MWKTQHGFCAVAQVNVVETQRAERTQRAGLMVGKCHIEIWTGLGRMNSRQFFCLYVPVYVPKWASGCLYKHCPLTTLTLFYFSTSFFSHFQAPSELILNSADFFKTNMIKIKTITIIFNIWNMAQKLVLLGGVNNNQKSWYSPEWGLFFRSTIGAVF